MERTASITAKHSLTWIESSVTLAPDRVRLRARLTGISAGTEGMWFNGTAPALTSGRRGYPYVPGYEFVGIVEAAGPMISADPVKFPRLSKLAIGDRVFAFKPHSSIADISEEDMWVSLPGHVEDLDALSLALACTCLHAIHRVGHQYGDDCAVLGLGMVGMIMIQILAASGASQIVAATTSLAKAELARHFGATDVVDTRQLTANGAKIKLSDAVYECSGTSAGIAASTRLAANQGRIGAVGFYVEDMPISGEDIFARELTIFGVRASGAADKRGEFVRWPRTENLKLAAKLVGEGRLRVTSLLTHKLKPAELEKAYGIIDSKSEPYSMMALDWQV